MDKLNAISLFCRVVETQSFTLAAQQAQISLAMASKLVSQLEEQLNVRLLQRTTRKVTPTDAGLLYYQRCLPILSELKEAEDCVSNISSTLQGKLSISVPLDFGTRFISPHLGRFIEKYPNVELHLDFSNRRVDVVSEGFDLVLRIGRLEDSSIVAKRIGQSRHLLVASPNYLAQYGTPQTLSDLDNHSLLLYENHLAWHFSHLGQSVRFKPQGKVYTNNGQNLLEMAKGGMGIANIPEFLVAELLESGQLVKILCDYRQDPIDISLLYPHRRHLSPKIKIAIEFLAELVGEIKSIAP